MTAVDVLVLAAGVVGLLAFGVWQGYRTERRRQEEALRQAIAEQWAPIREAMAAFTEAVRNVARQVEEARAALEHMRGEDG